ncbi:MAG TPA: serine hydrolase domain-containing protein [Vicinamibacteria bacterium]|nr:serine hydrolase domain-containing protein [Vicinamibacteria bacterium]
MRNKNAVRVLVTTLLLALAPFALAQELPLAAPEGVGMSSERLERLTETMQGYVDSGELAGAVVLVARHGQVAYLKAFGQRDRESAAPMREDTIFRIASQTKAIVSVAVMTLQEEGKLLISDPLGKYFPEFMETSVAVPRELGGYDVVAAKRPITIRDLLTHTSGIGYGGGIARDRWEAAAIRGWYFADREEPIRETVRRMAALPFDAQPGERFVYGYSTDILGALVEHVSGMPLDQALRTRIFEPLGMDDTHFYLPSDKRDRLATVYAADGLARAPESGGMMGQGLYAEGPRTSFSGGAGLLSTASNYARFLEMMLEGGSLDGRRVLSPNTVKLMTADHLVEAPYGSPGRGFGLGFEVLEDLGAAGEPGTVGLFRWGGAYHTTYWVDPAEDLVVTYMTQLIPAGDIDDHRKLRALVYQAIVDESPSTRRQSSEAMAAASPVFKSVEHP